MSNPFAILSDYPEEGPAMPEREKIVRTKDRSESGTGRRDRTKRDGRGPSNWGNPADDHKVNLKAEKIEEKLEGEEQKEVVEEKPKIQYVDPSQFFMDEEKVERPKNVKKESQVEVAKKYLDIMTKKSQEKKVYEREDKKDSTLHLETGFLSTDEALKQRQQSQRERQSGPRRGAPRNDRRPQGDRPPREQRPQGERPQGEGPQRKFADRPYRDETNKPHDDSKPRGERKPQNQNRPRNERTNRVQHQRQGAGPKGSLNLKNFPSL
jgi:hypothetical protein